MPESRAQEPMLSIPAGEGLDAPAAATGAPQGIPGSGLAGPFPVGEYAAALRTKLRSFARVELIAELVNRRPSRARVYFELRDVAGAIPCSAWREDWEAMLARAGATGPDAHGPSLEGMQVVLAGGCDYYPGSATSSPGFSLAVGDLRVAGEGDLLARIGRLGRELEAGGLLGLQKRLRTPRRRPSGSTAAAPGQSSSRRPSACAITPAARCSRGRACCARLPGLRRRTSTVSARTCTSSCARCAPARAGGCTRRGA